MDDGSREGSPAQLARAAIGGVLMGLANLVPGVSGGTMLLAAGVYTRFVDAIAEISTLRLRPRPILLLATIGLGAGAAILLLAGPVKDLVVGHRWVMYSLFIGLTLGGLPVVWRLVRPATTATWLGAAAGFLLMLLLAWAQGSGGGEAGGTDSSFGMLLLAGLAGASAMILPGVSGGYLLLVLGQYLPILGAIDALKEADSMAARLDPALHVLLPVGLGVGVGVVGVSNLLRWLLRRYEKATLGVLLGLLLGAVAGLWPFQRPIEPVLGETIIKGQLVTADTLAGFDLEDYPTETFPPSAAQGSAALGWVLLGLGATVGLARVGREG